MSIPSTTFPSYLATSEYQYRYLKIAVKYSPNKADSWEDAYDYAIKQAKDIAEITTSNDNTPTTTTKDTVKKVNKKIEEINKSLGTMEILEYINLPLPNELMDTQDHSWSQERGIAGTLADKFISGGIDKGLGNIMDTAGMRKPLADPGFFQSYQGSTPRTFNFSFDLIPNNQEDAANIFMILMKLRKYSLPTTGLSHVVLLSPYYFDIDFSNEYINVMMNIKGVVLTNISVNYGADGQMQQYNDGMPKQIKLDLTFAERRMQLADNY